MNDPHWIEYIKAFGPALIALFVAYVAWEQWRLNRLTLKERLFDRRMEFFRGSQKFLSEILRDAKFEQFSYHEFTDICQRAYFLFEKEFYDYLMNIRKRAGELRIFASKFEELPVGSERSLWVERHTQELIWLSDQLVENSLFEAFRPYLSFPDPR